MKAVLLSALITLPHVVFSILGCSLVIYMFEGKFIPDGPHAILLYYATGFITIINWMSAGRKYYLHRYG